MPRNKRIFDLVVTLLATPLWIPAIVMTFIAILFTSGWPVIYLSRRYVAKGSYRTVMKFRTMVKNAEQIANRDTVEPQPDRVLNIVINDALYTRLGKFLEKIHFTELPQLFQVMQGTLTLVGNRPMPENMLAVGRNLYPYLDERFSIPSGITGPAQLVGRDRLIDRERLKLEIAYCYICQDSYNPLLDLHMLAITTLTPLGFFNNLSPEKALELMMSYVDTAKRKPLLERVDATMNTARQTSVVRSG